MAKPEHAPFYASKRWRRARDAIYRRDKGLCQACKRKGKAVTGKEVDHIKPLESHRHLALVASNLELLCHSCHVKKTHRDSKKHARYCEHGYPIGICCND